MRTFIIISIILVLAIYIVASLSTKDEAIDMMIQWIMILIVIVGLLIFVASKRKDKKSEN